jgi:ribosomal-protein-alanine N-acetyltransferase
MSGECRVRVAVAEDLEAVLGIAGVCAEAPRWGEGVWRELLAGEGGVARAVFVAEMGGDVAGFVVVSCVKDVAEIESVAVLPAFRRMGLGRALCAEAMRWARDAGAQAMELEVRASSEGALALYAGLGFVEQGRRKGYYREPVDDAVLMSARLRG